MSKTSISHLWGYLPTLVKCQRFHSCSWPSGSRGNHIILVFLHNHFDACSHLHAYSELTELYCTGISLHFLINKTTYYLINETTWGCRWPGSTSQDQRLESYEMARVHLQGSEKKWHSPNINMNTAQ